MATLLKRNIETPYRTLDPGAIRDNAYLLQDCYIDNSGAIVKRPGSSLYFDFSTISSTYSSKGILGLYWFDERQTIIAVINGDIFEFSTLSGTYQKIGTGLLQTSTRVTFAKVQDNDNSLTTTLFMANGGRIIYWDGSTCDQIENNANFAGAAPTAVTHVAAVGQYLFANDNNEKALAKYALVSQPFKWTGGGGAAGYDIPAQAKTDNINGLYDNRGYIWIQGRQSIEPIQNTGQTPPFIRIQGGLVETGTVNPYALGIINKLVYLINTNQEISKIEGYNAIEISQSYATRIQELSSILDVEVDVQYSIGGKTFIIFNFKDANTSIVYDHSLYKATGKHAFYEWGEWNESNQSYDRYPYDCYAYATSWNFNLAGGRNDGKIYRIRTDKYTDNGTNIRSEIITGVYGNPFEEIKASDVYLQFRRGDGLDSDKYTKSYAYFQYRKNLKKTWSNRYKLDNGSVGQTELNKDKKSIGAYSTIQYRILHSDNAPMVLYGIYEKVKDVHL